MNQDELTNAELTALLRICQNDLLNQTERLNALGKLTAELAEQLVLEVGELRTALSLATERIQTRPASRPT